MQIFILNQIYVSNLFNIRIMQKFTNKIYFACRNYDCIICVNDA